MITKSWGVLLLGVYLIVVGVIPLLSLSFAYTATVLSVLAIAAGVCLLIGK